MFSSNTSQVSEDANYIEQVFATHLYTGNGSTQTINNGIDLAGEGGLVWIKGRDDGAHSHCLYDTLRGRTKQLNTNYNSAETITSSGATEDFVSFNTDGFTLGEPYNTGNLNATAMTKIVSWTFRKQPKFFDVVTYTGNGVNNTLISHNLGSTPGCVIIKRTDTTENWAVNHRGDGTGNAWTQMSLNSTSAGSQGVAQNYATSTTVRVDDVIGAGSSPNGCNVNGATYVMYLFAHNAGGFGESGEDNVISCGSFTQASGGTTVNLGFEPQWVMVKNASGTGNWFIFDNMRGNTVTLYPNLSNAEGDQGAGSFQYNATGFTMADYITGAVGDSLIYIAIRRGPMKTPTSGAEVFSPDFQEATPPSFNTGFVADAGLRLYRPGGGEYTSYMFSRLTGTAYMSTTNTNAESTTPSAIWDFNNGWGDFGLTTTNVVNESFRRAPGFFDVVCWTNNSNPQVNTHNLGVRPELAITKTRNDAYEWFVGANIGATTFDGLELNSTAAGDIGRSYTSSSAYKGFTATTFTTGGSPAVGAGGFNCVTYLFATCPGVSKVGSYTGTGTTQQINCGFTGGARFVLVKATSTTGDWLVADSARGIVSGNDPYLELNTTNAEVTGEDWLDTDSSGFVVNEVAGSNANTNGVTYIYLAIA